MTLNSAFGDRGVGDDVKTVHYSYIFGRSDNLMPTLLKKIMAQAKKIHNFWWYEFLDSFLSFERFARN